MTVAVTESLAVPPGPAQVRVYTVLVAMPPVGWPPSGLDTPPHGVEVTPTAVACVMPQLVAFAHGVPFIPHQRNFAGTPPVIVTPFVEVAFPHAEIQRSASGSVFRAHVGVPGP